MRILVLQLLPAVRRRPTPRFDPHLGSLLALLESRGHELALLGLDRLDLAALKSALAQRLPQIVYADVSAVATHLARRVCEYIQSREFLSIVVGGAYPSADPGGALSLPGVNAVAIGEPDATLVTYLERLTDPAAAPVSGVWVRDERGLARPPMPPLVEDLDSLPPPNRDLFNYAEYVKRTGVIEIAVGRGCAQRCGYCPNPQVAHLYDPSQTWERRRSAPDILSEIDALRSAYQPVRLVRFLDHAFATDVKWLDEFLDPYVYRCALPFRCHLRLNRTTDEVVRLLDDAGCHLVDVEVINASDFIRNEIFQMELSNQQIESAFERLHRTNIRTRAVVYVGSPYDGEASLEDTRRLLQRVRPDAVDVRPYFPFPGTTALEVARENGWLHARGEEQYARDAAGIDMPACRPQRIDAFVRKLRLEFPAELDQPWWRRWSNASRSALGQIFTRRSS